MNYKTIFIAGTCFLAATISWGALPKTITTRDGQVYRGVSLIRAEPDGYLVNYQPGSNSVGIAKIKFARLPADMQRQANYNAGDAREFESAVADAQQEYANTLIKMDVEAKALKQAQQAWLEESATRQKAANAAAMEQALAQENAPVTTSVYTGISCNSGLVLVPVPGKTSAEKTTHVGVQMFNQILQLPTHKGVK